MIIVVISYSYPVHGPFLHWWVSLRNIDANSKCVCPARILNFNWQIKRLPLTWSLPRERRLQCQKQAPSPKPASSKPLLKQRVYPTKSFRDRRNIAWTNQIHPGKRRRRIDLKLRKVLRQEKNGAERQKPGDRQRHDNATKESSHVQILWEAEG